MEVTTGLVADIADELFNFSVEAAAEFGSDRGVVFDGTDIFLTRIGMKDVRFHRRRVLRMRAETSLARMPLTLLL